MLIDRARRNAGVITTAEARGVGASTRQLAALERDGVFIRRHPGVYLLSGFPRDHRLEVRAALAALHRDGALHSTTASHASAAWLQGLVDRPPPEVHITTTAGHARRLAGVIVHRTAPDPRAGRRLFDGIACTPPARTLVDLAPSLAPAGLADAVDRALSKRLVRIADLEAETRRGGRRRGTDQLRRCLGERGYTGVPAPSVLEGRMARLLTHFGLPVAKPECIAGPDGEYRLDYAYPLPRLMMELYGYTWHHSPEQMAGDLARQRRLTLEGWTTLVFTWLDVTREPERVAREIREALTAAERLSG